MRGHLNVRGRGGARRASRERAVVLSVVTGAHGTSSRIRCARNLGPRDDGAVRGGRVGIGRSSLRLSPVHTGLRMASDALVFGTSRWRCGAGRASRYRAVVAKVVTGAHGTSYGFRRARIWDLEMAVRCGWDLEMAVRCGWDLEMAVRTGWDLNGRRSARRVASAVVADQIRVGSWAHEEAKSRRGEAERDGETSRLTAANGVVRTSRRERSR